MINSDRFFNLTSANQSHSCQSRVSWSDWAGISCQCRTWSAWAAGTPCPWTRKPPKTARQRFRSEIDLIAINSIRKIWKTFALKNTIRSQREKCLQFVFNLWKLSQSIIFVRYRVSFCRFRLLRAALYKRRSFNRWYLSHVIRGGTVVGPG